MNTETPQISHLARPRCRGRRRGVAAMAKLIYVSNVSLDGYIEDEDGGINWTPPDDELFAFITDLVRPVGTFLYGRRLYEMMAPWETEPALAAQSKLRAGFANVWQAADKVVYSTTLQSGADRQDQARGRFRPRLGTRPESIGHQ